MEWTAPAEVERQLSAKAGRRVWLDSSANVASTVAPKEDVYPAAGPQPGRAAVQSLANRGRGYWNSAIHDRDIPSEKSG